MCSGIKCFNYSSNRNTTHTQQRVFAQQWRVCETHFLKSAVSAIDARYYRRHSGWPVCRMPWWLAEFCLPSFPPNHEHTGERRSPMQAAAAAAVCVLFACVLFMMFPMVFASTKHKWKRFSCLQGLNGDVSSVFSVYVVRSRCCSRRVPQLWCSLTTISTVK